MKTRCFLLTVSLILAGLFTSCDKTNNDNSGSDTGTHPLLTTVSQWINDTTEMDWSFNYNSNYQLTSMRVSSYYGSVYSRLNVIYNYSKDSVVVFQKDGGTDTIVERDVYYLNSAGLAKKVIKLGAGLSSYNSTVSYFTYDQNNHLVLDSTYWLNLSTKVIRTYQIGSDGNCSQQVVKTSSGSGTTTSTITYSFTSNKNTIGNINMGISFLGAQNTNMIATTTTTPNTSGTNPVIFTYVLDDLGRTIKQTGNNGMNVTYLYCLK